MLTLDVGLDAITHLAFSPAGTQLALTAFGGIAVGHWPLVGDQPFSIIATTERVVQVAWHPAGTLFATASPDGFVQVWDLRGRLRKELIELSVEDGHTTAVAFSPDGRRLATAGGWWGEPGSVVVFEASYWRRTISLRPHANQVGAIAFADDATLVTGSADKSIAASTLDPHAPPRRLESLPSPVQSIAIRPGRRQVAVAAGNAIHLVELEPNERPLSPAVCRGHKRVVKAIDFSPDGRTLASVGEDGTLRFWDADTGAATAALDLALEGLRAVAFAPDGLTALAGGDRGIIAIVDVDG